MSRSIQILAIVVLAIALFGCPPSTMIKNSWHDPSITPNSLQFKKILVVGMFKDSISRRASEDELVNIIQARSKGSATAVASHTILDEGDVKNVEQAKAKVASQGFDGVVSMRLAGKEQQQTWVPGTTVMPYGGFWGGYYGYGWGLAYDPGYLRTDTVVHVETLVYSMQDDKLIWGAVSESVNPNDAVNLTRDVAKAVGGELEKQGWIAKK
jgi:hypothetical protein